MNVIPATFLETVNTSQFQGKQKKLQRKKDEKVLYLENSGGWVVMHIPAESETCLNFMRLTTSSLLMLNAEQQWRQAITVYSGDTLKEQYFSLPSF